MHVEQNAGQDTSRSDDDFGCGWSVTSLLCNLYTDAPSAEVQPSSDDMDDVHATPPMIYRVA